MSAPPNEVKIVYHDAENKIAIPVTGAYGGVTPDGSSVVAHLYVEHGTVPSITTVAIEGNVVDFSKTQDVKRGEITRQVQAMLVMSPEAAQGLGRWLQQKSKEALRNRSAKEKS